MILFRNGSEICSADRYANLQSEETALNLGLRVKGIPVCIRCVGTLGGCGLQSCCQVYDGVCRADGFGLHLAKGCDLTAPLNPCKKKKKTSSEAFGIHQLGSCMLDQGSCREESPVWVRRQFLADSCASKLKGKSRTIIKRCFDRICLQCGAQLI